MKAAVLSMLVVMLAAGTIFAAAAPNVIIFYTDDMGNGDLGCYGATDIKTPEIDRLAASGMRFTNYYAPAPICSPSRAGMLTGRYPVRAGMSSGKNIPSAMDKPGLPTREITIAELAKEKGYATAAFGKWHLGSTYDCQPNSQGFDLFVGHHASCVDSFSHWYYASEPWYHDLYRNREEIFEDGVHMTDIITRETLAFIDANREKPFLIYAAYNTPHYPMVAHGKYMKQYAHLDRLRQQCAALVSGVDDSVGQVIGRLRERNLLDNTLVFFASDNGAPDPSGRGEGGGRNTPYREFKRSVFDGGMHVPGMVSWPGKVPPQTVCDQPVIGMDIFATIVHAIGAALPADRIVDGKSWYPLFKDPKQSIHEALCFEWEGQFAVRSGQWKLVGNGLIDMTKSRSNRATGEDALYLADARADPGEKQNRRVSHPEVASRLKALYEEWHRGVAGDPTASPDCLTEPAK